MEQTNTFTSTQNPPNAVPSPGTQSDGNMVIGVTGLWLLALIVAFSVFAFMPKLYTRFRRTRQA